MLVVAFENSMRIITIPYVRVSCIVDTIAGKMGLAGEQNDTNHLGFKINTTAQFQPATHVRRFKILNVLDVVRNLPLSCRSSRWHYFSQFCKRIRNVG
jgi:hypothetical protein